MMYLGIALVYLAITRGSFCNYVHTLMSREEIQRIFHTNPDSVPKYEITKIHVSEKLHKRDLEGGTKMHITAFGEDINLWLHPTNPILAGEDTPVYFAKHSPGKPENVEFTRRNGIMQMVGRIFEDPNWRASLVIGTEESTGGATVNGYIASQRLAVRSLPTHVAEAYRRRRRSIDDSNDDGSPLHVVFRTLESYDEDLAVLPIDSTALWERVALSSFEKIPDTIYPEILVVVEHSVYRNYERDIYGMLQYILAFMNGVDLKYRSISHPKIRFHISGIVLAKDAEATPYISSNSLGIDVFNSHKAMPDATKFFYAVKDTFPLGSYDIPITITSQLFGINGSEDILGQAWLGFACRMNVDRKTVNSVTIIQDDGTFSGIHVAAHEIGHLLGASHDTHKTKDDCLYSNGFLMSFTPWFTKNSSDFSTCSVDGIYNTLQNNRLDCLFNVPPTANKILPKLMPGRMKDLEAQCKSLNARASCQNPDGPTDICLNIFCEDHFGRCMGTGSAAIDGTTCGDNKFCLHMECVSL